MIERVHFKNFRALKRADLKLGPFNLIVGPNGSGKSTALQALETLAQPGRFNFAQLVTANPTADEVAIEVLWNQKGHPDTALSYHHEGRGGGRIGFTAEEAIGFAF